MQDSLYWKCLDQQIRILKIVGGKEMYLFSLILVVEHIKQRLHIRQIHYLIMP
ncbi:unnamed protein product [Paramecium sonneborni]|uniref:Uncharacterized protein n=1 Tax=Paramecium sonneborni TaxID=65129 RepID=A0A8S1RVR7_9CILI|nr:unnamed protein product [Paramecium sonneborni]